jgi:hypothetical protein
MRSSLALVALLAGSPAFAADGPACKTFDPSPACCPHPPPTCCEPSVAAPVDDAAVAQVCGAPQPKGQAGGLNLCKHYYERGDLVGEVAFGREPGDAAAFDKLQKTVAGARSRVEAATIAGTQRAFVIRQTDETGKLERTSVFALVGAEIVHLDVEHNVCDGTQTLRLFQRALERLRTTPPTGRRAG